MKTVGLLLLLLVAVAVAAPTRPARQKPPTTATAAATATQTNQTEFCCRHPLRIFGDQTTVNLKPLFHWWTEHEHATDQTADATRPLTNWRRITGTKASDLEYNWVVNAVIYTSPGTSTTARIILKNPPVTEEKAFTDLKNQIAQLNLQATNNQQAYQAELKAAQKADTRAQAEKNRARSRRTRSKNNDSTRQAAQDNAAATTALNEEKKLESARALAEKQLAAIPAANGRYQIDWFALEIGRNQQGIPIYDLGVVNPNSP